MQQIKNTDIVGGCLEDGRESAASRATAKFRIAGNYLCEQRGACDSIQAVIQNHEFSRRDVLRKRAAEYGNYDAQALAELIAKKQINPSELLRPSASASKP